MASSIFSNDFTATELYNLLDNPKGVYVHLLAVRLQRKLQNVCTIDDKGKHITLEPVTINVLKELRDHIDFIVDDEYNE